MEKCNRCKEGVKNKEVAWFQTKPHCKRCYGILKWKAREERRRKENG